LFADAFVYETIIASTSASKLERQMKKLEMCRDLLQFLEGTATYENHVLFILFIWGLESVGLAKPPYM
jgi:hypothetical protein